MEVSQRSLGGQRQPLSTPLCLVVTPFVRLPTLLLSPWGQAFPLLQIQIRDPHPACLLLTGGQRGMIKEIKARRKKESAWGNLQAGSGVKTHLATRHPGESLWALVLHSGCSLWRLGPRESEKRAASLATPGLRQGPESGRSPGEVGGFVTGREGSTRGWSLTEGVSHRGDAFPKPLLPLLLQQEAAILTEPRRPSPEQG